MDFGAIPVAVEDWTSQDYPLEEQVVAVLKSDETLFRRYVNSDGEEISLFIGYWADQKYGAQPHSPLHCLPGSGWNIISNENESVAAAGNGESANLNLAVISNGEETDSMIYWYQTRSGSVKRELQVKLALAKNALLGRATDIAFIRLTGSSDVRSLFGFAQMLQPYLLQAFSR